jgi:16S rRNA (adenine1518-N6/adenine1519-N6)-dimethyltransferase
MPPPAKRRLGQHFLTDPRILARIADALEATEADTVVEIGPGRGGLTAALAARAGRVIAIEKDPALVPALRERLPAVQVVEADALTVDWSALAAAPTFLLAGNIPYNITSPLVEKALEPPLPRRIVFLVQREVAERIAAPPGTSEYGALTVGVQARAVVELLFRVSAGAFAPRPKVDSAVIRLTPLASPAITDDQRRGFRRLVVGLFGFRRKQLIRGLRELTGWAPEFVGPILDRISLDPATRPEKLTVGDFANLRAALVDAGWVED